MTSPASPFADIPPVDWLASNRSAFAIADAYPVSEGHALVVPRRLIATWWEASRDERHDLMDLVDEVKALLDERHQPDGYNVGFNAGAAAGQTVEHLHLHVIPRYAGDVADPRGGIRHVIPGKGNYLAASGDRPIDATPAAVPPAELFDGIADRRLLLELIRCLRNDQLDRIDLVVSFIMKSGLAQLAGQLADAIERGAAIRVLTTDYLAVTDADALARLLDMAETAVTQPGSLEVRVWHDPSVSFHPKAYLFRSSDGRLATGFVGSSNLSRSGIDGGVEWNLGVRETGALVASFDRLWDDPRSRPLDHDFLRAYRQVWKPRAGEVVDLGVVTEPPVQPVEPWPVQRDALDALEATRADGYTAGLVVMATGLGKTWVAAFDTARPEFRRVLFIAHRIEILRQTRDAFRKVRPDAELGLYYGDEKQPGADVVFASIDTLSGRFDEFDPAEFDYVVIDEFHHAAATTYRQVIAHFAPRFLLGLTATPERMDGADLLGLCGDNLVFDCDLVTGIRQGNLVPFDYWGIPAHRRRQGAADGHRLHRQPPQLPPEAPIVAVARPALDAHRRRGDPCREGRRVRPARRLLDQLRARGRRPAGVVREAARRRRPRRVLPVVPGGRGPAPDRPPGVPGRAQPEVGRKSHSHWFGLLGDLSLLSDEERAVVDDAGDTLSAIEREPITKAYKLVTLMALCQEGAPTHGARNTGHSGATPTAGAITVKPSCAS